ncbi:MAG: TIGR04076 family protein [Chloroflexi bacterium]|nr:TIGR04076 family protein [Chloroflexota bacterium]
MAEKYDILVKIVSQQGTCTHEHKVGQQWLLSGKTPAGMCTSAYNAIYPNARVLMFGGSFPWEENQDVNTVVCPDPKNPVVFEMRRLRK